MDDAQIVHAIATTVLSDSGFYSRLKGVTFKNRVDLLQERFPDLEENYWLAFDVAFLMITTESQDEFLKGLEKLAK